ncbi:MAG: hypothetical protein ACI8XV_000197 [Arenicella sp.]
MKIEAVIITLDRSPRKNYLPSTLDSLKKSGLFEHAAFTLSVHHDGLDCENISAAEALDSRVAVIKGGNPLLGYNLAAVRAIRYACAQSPDFVLFMEDDIKVCPDFPEFVIATINEFGASPLMDFATYYQEIVDAYLEGNRSFEMDAVQFYGTQCYVSTCADMQSYADFIERNHNIKPGFADIWFDSWLEESGRPRFVKCAVPAAAQHIGVESSHGHGFIDGPAFQVDLEKSILSLSGYYQVFEKNDDGLTLRNSVDNTFLKLNDSAQLIYLYCDGVRNLGQIIDELNSELELGRTVISSQVRECIHSLVDAGVLSRL